MYCTLMQSPKWLTFIPTSQLERELHTTTLMGD